MNRIEHLQNLQGALRASTEDWRGTRDVVNELINLLVRDEERMAEMAKARKEENEPKCEVCGSVVDDGYDLIGCEKCSKMFGPCCNSHEDGICVECV